MSTRWLVRLGILAVFAVPAAAAAERRAHVDGDALVVGAEHAERAGGVALAHQLAAEHRDASVELRQALVRAAREHRVFAGEARNQLSRAHEPVDVR